jgi:hypothetical protein
MAQAAPFIAQNAVALIGTAVAAGGTAASIQQSRKANAAQKEADKASRAAAEIANQRNIRQNIVRARAAQAQLIATGQASGGGFGSSPIQGALGASQTQAASNVGFARSQLAAGNAINTLQSQARGFESNAATFGAISKLPSQFGFDTESLFKNLKDQAGN